MCYNKGMILYDLKHVGLARADKTILKDITLTVSEGEWLTITGPSGGGKSTLLKIMASLSPYSQGEIYYDGNDLQRLNPVDYRKEVSYCFQQPVLFGQTVADNLAFPFTIRQLPFDQHRALAALAAVDLPPRFLEQAISELSGGEKQRVALVRNLLFDPRVLLLDEVTAGLDAVTKSLVRGLIKQYHEKGKTIIEVTHDQTELAEARQVVKIVGGELIYD